MPPTAIQLQRILHQKIGIRVGMNLNGEAYAMSDFGGKSDQEEFLFPFIPDNFPDLSQAWDHHLFNTFCSIFGFQAPGDQYDILLITQAGPTAERCLVENGVGNRTTFRRCDRLPGDARILARAVFMGGEIAPATAWVFASL